MAIKRRSRASVEFSMSSMTDLIFLLLIFFMITASFVAPSTLNLTLPKAAEQTKITEPNLIISIDKDLNYFIGDEVSIAEADLPNKMQMVLSGVASGIVLVNADRSVPIENVVKVMTLGQQYNAKVLLKTKPN